MAYVIDLDTERLAQGLAPFKVTCSDNGTWFWAVSRPNAADMIKSIEKNGLDIIAQLWHDIIPELRAAVVKFKYGTEFDKFKLVYKKNSDTGELFRGATKIGDVWVDWGEPCLRYKLNKK